MPTMLTEEDLSLRHLPEVSDYSISFQIPTSITQSDDLLAESGKDFFKGVNDYSILATPIATTNSTFEIARNQPIPRSLVSGSSLPYRNLRPRPTQLGSVGDSCNHAEVQTSSVVEQRFRAPKPKLPGNDPEIEHKRELPRNRPHPTPSLTNMDIRLAIDIPSSKPSKSTFSERSPVGSHLEDPEHLSALSRTQSHVQIMHADTNKGNQEREKYKVRKLQGLQKTSVEKRSRHMSLKAVSRCGTQTNQLNGSVGLNGILKSRTQRKTASSDYAGFLGKKTGITNGSSAVKEQFICPEEPDDDSTGFDDLTYAKGLSPLLSGRGTAGHLILYGQQLMNAEENTMENSTLRARRTEEHCEASHLEHMQLEKFATEDEEHQSDPSLRRNGGTTAVINEEVGNGDESLTVLQLSSRGHNMKENNDPSMSSVLERPPLSNRKRRLTFASAECPDQRPHKKGKARENAISDEIPSIFKATPTPIFSFPSEEMFPNPTSAASSPVISENIPPKGGSVLKESNTGEEQGDRTRRSKSKNTVIASSLSTFVNNKVDRRSGTDRHMKKTAKGIGTRLRKLSKTSSFVSGGRVLRPRSVSASAAVRVDILDASTREKQLARLRTRRNAQGKGKGGYTKNPNTGEGVKLVGTSVGEKKDCRVTRSQSSARVDENKNASDDYMDLHRWGEQRKSRSSSSLSNSSNNSNRRSRRLEALLDSTSNSSQGSKRTYRKENIRAVIPQPFQWATEERMRERRKFDEIVKEKEREKEALMEQKRKEREEEEERELRELRRKMVPKANAVPEWYKDIPKKKKRGGNDGSQEMGIIRLK